MTQYVDEEQEATSVLRFAVRQCIRCLNLTQNLEHWVKSGRGLPGICNQHRLSGAEWKLQCRSAIFWPANLKPPPNGLMISTRWY